MMSRFARGLAAAAALGTAATMASAQDEESTNRVAADTDWSVFVEDDPRECWGVSAPKNVRNTQDGQVVEVTRGDILLFVFYRPEADVDGQVTFTGGYPFAGGSTVEVDIGGDTYELFTEGEWAWPATPDDDQRIIDAMEGGAEAVLTAESSRGTQTQDTFSLMGFTAALEEAQRRCAES